MQQADGQLTDSLDDLHTCASDGGERIDHISLVNTDTSDVTVHLYFLPSGGTPASDERNIIGKDLVLTPNAHMVVDKPVYLANGDKIRGYASTPSKVDYIIQGIQFAIEGVVS
jgi:hypothetical protein